MKFTVEQICAVADQLVAEGVKPTQSNVRQALGGGSFTTISNALKQWRTEQTTEVVDVVVLPQALESYASTFVTKLWETAQVIANDSLKVEREALEQCKVQAKIELDEMIEVIETLETEQEQLQQKLLQLEEANSAYAVRVSELEEVNGVYAIELDKAKEVQSQLTQRLSDEQARVDDLQRRNDVLQDENKLMIKQLSKLEAVSSAKDDKIEDCKQQIVQKNDELVKFRESYTEDLKQLQQKLLEESKELVRLVAVVEQQKQDKLRTDELLVALRSEIDKLNLQLSKEMSKSKRRVKTDSSKTDSST